MGGRLAGVLGSLLGVTTWSANIYGGKDAADSAALNTVYKYTHRYTHKYTHPTPLT